MNINDNKLSDSPEMNIVIACVKQWINDYCRAKSSYRKHPTQEAMAQIKLLECQYKASPILTWVDYDFVISNINKKYFQEELKNGIKKRKERSNRIN